MTRRLFLSACAATAARAAGGTGFRVGITDWNLRLGAKPEAVALAAALGFDGVQISFGRATPEGRLPLDDAALLARYRSLSQQHRIPIDGSCVDMLHTDGLKNGGPALRWVSDSIRMTRALGTQVLLLPFFGKQATRTQAERDYVADTLRELGTEAEQAGIILGLENENSAAENVAIMERSRSSAVRVYYDVGNSTNIGGYDVEKEIRWLGKDRICQIHLKDKPPLLGQGGIQFEPIVRAILDINYTGYANLETDSRPGFLEDDLKINLAYIRRLSNG